MASNGLVANPSKTTFMILNHKSENKISIQVGNVRIEQEDHTKILGMTLDSNQKWTSHVTAKGGLTASLNQRLYVIKRLKNHLPLKQLKCVAESLWTSKLRYGLQIWADVRMEESCPSNYLVNEAQKSQNKLLRILSNKKLSDRVSTKKLLESNQMLSVNQLSAQIKLTEMWKAKYVEDYPIKFACQTTGVNARETRGNAIGKMIETAKSTKSKASFCGDAPRIWNKAPLVITMAKSLSIAKKEIKKFCFTLPI